MDVSGKDVTLEFTTADAKEGSSAQSLKHWDSNLSVSGSFRTAQEPASRSLTKLATPRGHAISESRDRSSGPADDMIGAAPYQARPANPPGAIRYASPPPPGQQLNRMNSPQRPHSGRGTAPASYGDVVSQHAAAGANLPARYANLRTGVSRQRSGSSRMTPPQSPYANGNPSESRSPHGAIRGGPMSSGNLSGPLSGRGLFPTYDGIISGRENPSKSVEMIPGILLPFCYSFVCVRCV